MQQSEFELRAGATFIVPEKVRITQSENAREFPDTPRIVTAYQDKETGLCHLEPTQRLLENPQRIGIFVPAGVAPGQTLRLEWAQENCACAYVVN